MSGADEDLIRAIAMSMESIAVPKWLCTFCAKENSGSASVCGVCGIARDREKRVASAVSSPMRAPQGSGAHAAPHQGPFTCEVCTFLNPSGAKCSICDAPRPADVGPRWTCCGCTTKNEAAKDKCLVCGTPRPRYVTDFVPLVDPIILAKSDDAQYLALLEGNSLLAAASIRGGAASGIPKLPNTSATFSLRRADLGEAGSRFWSYVLQEIGDSYTILQLEQAGVMNWVDRCMLFPLRTSGDGKCLLHAASQAMWGIQDDSHSVKTALIRALGTPEFATEVRLRWERELIAADSALPEEFRVTRNFEADWDEVVELAHRDQDDLRHDGRRVGIGGSSLMNVHVYALAQILRRPIVVIADMKSAVETGESISGIYLPTLCPAEECSRVPLFIAYTPGHFIALVPIQGQTTHAPLCDRNGIPLEIKFELPIVARRDLLECWLDLSYELQPQVRECVPFSLEAYSTILPSSMRLYQAYISQAKERYDRRA